MTFKFPLMAAACAAVFSLTACGGGGSSGSNAAPEAVSAPTALKTIDSVVGTGAEAANGKKLTVKYTGWLYSTTAAENKGNQFETSTFTFTLGVDSVIAGWTQGIPGMKVGGKRTLHIPASLAYGKNGRGPIPPNTGLVFDVELLKVE
ncbi:FKBP-type peptidyl-prolyl cis-trans isomerase [Massilia sp. IC2-278]|uniref:FKBP-type peptidyl-prolyl cis-trans isomerase n=1 Tax=Massilia sp. IC2-278 TaxID=2887200 RepID=UPI001E538327|nr:FKBP-type peptidyl-prolyl cis-trans isomerase [Massilia sp. IC2-278]MCC2960013.1 FKBP-type peptidyl-prolyl cis-trans isomerase [Massilia sp. IC2-278]